MIAQSLAEALTFPMLFKGVFVASGIWLAFTWKRDAEGSERQLGAAIVAFLALVSAIYLVTPHDLDWHLNTSLNRVLLQTYLLAIVLLLATVHRGEANPPRPAP